LPSFLLDDIGRLIIVHDMQKLKLGRELPAQQGCTLHRKLGASGKICRR